MEGAVDSPLKVVGTIEERLLTRINIHTFKSRIGDGKPVVYDVVNGIPQRKTTTTTDRLLDLLSQCFIS
jgi:hypothetical protein